MSVSTRSRRHRSLVAITRLLRDLFDPHTYRRIAYLLLALPLGILEFSFLTTAISFGVGTVITLIGIPVLIATVYAWRWMAGVERRLIGGLTGVQIPSPYRPVPQGGWLRKISAMISDPATWKDLVFLLLQLGLGIISFTFTTVVLGVGLGALLAPAWYWALEGGIDVGILQVDTLLKAAAVTPVGALVLFTGIPGLGALGRLYGRFASLFLGTDPDPELAAQVTDLQGARSRIIAAADAERRRIERDLHDGAQQRLVAMSLTLRMAESRAEKGDPEAAELIRQAGGEAGLALKELRDLARGIHPAILTNRGLRAALDDLASRASLPVTVTEAPAERLPDQVEAAVYFVVSECLANVDKHAQAGEATVAVRSEAGSLLVEVADDGVGGAGQGVGSGLQGLQDRVGALDGSLTVESPAGKGTLVRALIPLAVTDETSDPVLEQRLPTQAEAELYTARRRAGLRGRLGALGVIASVVVIVWISTGAPNAWPVWPLLALGLIGGLDAWFVLGKRPLVESDLSGAEDRETELRDLRRRRSLRMDAGALGILNLALVGVWLAAGAGYFWPVWPIIGCAVALAIKSLRWPGLARERLMGDPSQAPR